MFSQSQLFQLCLQAACQALGLERDHSVSTETNSASISHTSSSSHPECLCVCPAGCCRHTRHCFQQGDGISHLEQQETQLKPITLQGKSWHKTWGGVGRAEFEGPEMPHGFTQHSCCKKSFRCGRERLTGMAEVWTVMGKSLQINSSN